MGIAPLERSFKVVSGRHKLTLIFQFLFVAKIICRELYLDPEKKGIYQHLSLLTKVLKSENARKWHKRIMLINIYIVSACLKACRILIRII